MTPNVFLEMKFKLKALSDLICIALFELYFIFGCRVEEI